jgi:hypothetical protein
MGVGAWAELSMSRHVDVAHEIHAISDELVFPNPYLWRCRSYVLVVWRPGPPPCAPVGLLFLL